MITGLSHVAVSPVRSPAGQLSAAPAVRREPVGSAEPNAAVAAPSAAGNMAVQRLMREHGIQARLTVDQSQDPLEHQAESAARAAGAAGVLPDSRPAAVHRGATSGSGAASVPGLVPGSGEPLPAESRRDMERHFREDFGAVRIHRDAQASRAAETLSAHAFTLGNHIVFRQYAPESTSGRQLLAHELTHVIQQRSAGSPPVAYSRDPTTTDVSPAAESEAVRAAAASTAGAPFTVTGRLTAPVVQSQANPDAAYNIDLRYSSTRTDQHRGLSTGQALRVLQSYATWVEGNIQGGYEGHKYLKQIHDEQYIVAGISDILGFRTMPSLFMWEIPRLRLQIARGSVARGDIRSAERELQEAAASLEEAHRRIYEYREGTIAGAERAVIGLQVVETASTAIVTVGSGGLAGAALTGAERLAGEWSSVQVGLQQRIDWGGVVFDTLFAAVAGKFAGRLGSAVSARIGTAIAARVGSALVARIGSGAITSVIVGRGASLVYAAARQVFDAARGRTELTVDGFIERLAAQLSLRGAFLDLVAYAAGSSVRPAAGGAGGPGPVAGPPAGPTARPPFGRLTSIQGGKPGAILLTGGRVVSQPPPVSQRPPIIDTGPYVPSGSRGGALAYAQQQMPVEEPLPLPPPPVREVPPLEVTPPPTPAPLSPSVAAGVVTGAIPTAAPFPAPALAPAPSTGGQNQPLQVRLVLPPEKAIHAYLYGMLIRQRALHHTPNVPRQTAQDYRWDRALRPAGEMGIREEIWQQLADYGIEVSRRTRPNWSRTSPFIPMQVDHRVEWQLLNEANRRWGDSMPNYELLDQPSNGRSGNALRLNIDQERARLVALTGTPAWWTQTIEFTELVVPEGAATGERWLPEEIRDGEHYDALRAHERRRLRGMPSPY